MGPLPHDLRRALRAPLALPALLALLAIASPATLLGCGDEPPPAETPAPPPVQLGEARTERQTPYSTSTAEIVARQMATLRAEAAGRVIALRVERGERVRAGQILAKLDTGRTAAAVGAANAGIEQAEAAFAQAQRERELVVRLERAGSASRQQLDQAEDGVRLARAALSSARAQLRLTRRGLTEAVLRAPFSGTVVETPVNLGEFVAPGAPMVVVVDTSRLEARVLLDPREALDVEVGASALVDVFARDGERFEGRVLRVSDVVDSRTRRLPIEVEVLDPEARLRPGLMARVSVQTGAEREALTVATRAVVERFGDTYVFQVRDGVAVRVPVTVERATQRGLAQGRTIVSSGLQPGDRIIVSGLDRVVAGGNVTVVPTGASSTDEPSGPTARAETDSDEDSRDNR